MKKQSSLARLFEYAGNFKYLTILSWIFSAVSAWIALVPFYYIWRVIKEVLDVAPHYENAGNLANYGWHAVGFAILSMFFTFADCSAPICLRFMCRRGYVHN